MLLPLAAALLLGAVVVGSAHAGEGPSAGTVLATDLVAPRGMTIGPDGMIYIAEAGTGGDTEFVVEDGTTVMNGFTGRISSIDPATGTRTTVSDGLPSQLGPFGDTVGPADVAFIGDQLYLLLTHGGEGYGFPETPTGIYAVADDGDITLVADIGEFNINNPVEAITSGAQGDIEPGGNPYSMTVRDGMFYVVDGNHNRLMEVTTGGDVSEIVEFPDHPVSTGIAETESGPFYVAYLGRAPFLPQDGKVVTVAPLTGAITEIAGGVPMLSDVAVGSGGQVYALSFGEFAAGFSPFTGSIQRVNADGTMSPLVTGLSFATDMLLDGDTMYVVDDGLSALGPGEIIEIENFSSLQPIAPTPTAAAPVATPTSTGITAPDTGSGGYGAGDGFPGALVAAVALALAAVAATGGATLALRRR